jgi:hypothetical protein
LQSTVARQIRSKKTPILEFRPDEVIRAAERIDRILRENPSPAMHDAVADETADDETADDETVDDETADDDAFTDGEA